MNEFSGLYKKMCEKAERVQKDWMPQEWDDCCEKGDYKDGFSREVHLGIMSNEEREF